MKTAKLDHYLAGLEGIALSRHWLLGDRDRAARHFDALGELVQGGDRTGIEFDAPGLGVTEGYARWASTYDRFPNPLIQLEQQVVHRCIDALPIGVALDAACGSGRHSAYLAARGHSVIGVDTSPEMLAAARERLPQVELRQGTLESLPLDSGSVDLVVCALALTHCPRLEPAITELARVVRPGGRVVISDFHPMMGLLGNTALFLDAEMRVAFVDSYAHLHSDYFAAFAAAGLRVLRCEEPRYGEAQLSALSVALPPRARPAIEGGMLGLPGALVWELTRS